MDLVPLWQVYLPTSPTYFCQLLQPCLLFCHTRWPKQQLLPSPFPISPYLVQLQSAPSSPRRATHSGIQQRDLHWAILSSSPRSISLIPSTSQSCIPSSLCWPASRLVLQIQSASPASLIHFIIDLDIFDNHFLPQKLPETLHLALVESFSHPLPPLTSLTLGNKQYSFPLTFSPSLLSLAVPAAYRIPLLTREDISWKSDCYKSINLFVNLKMQSPPLLFLPSLPSLPSPLSPLD